MKKPERRTSLGVFFKDQQYANHSNEQQSFFLASPISNTSYAFSLNDKSSVAESVSVYLDDDDKSPNAKPTSSRRLNSSLENLFLDPLDAKTNKKKDGEKHRKKKSSSTKKKKKKAQKN